MKYEPYADKGRPTNYVILELLAICSLLAVLWGWKHTEHSWWNSFSVANRRFIAAVCLETVGAVFLWLRIKRGSLWPSSIWDFRDLLFVIACLIAGIVGFVEVFQLR
jgi:hypothetical protein